MKELLTIGSSLIVVFGGFCGILLKITNGRLNKELDKKVDREACHIAQKGVHKRIDDLDKHLSDKMDMAIELIKNNGK